MDPLTFVIARLGLALQQAEADLQTLAAENKALREAATKPPEPAIEPVP